MSDTLQRLWETILSRRGSDPEQSYTARLFAKGLVKIGQKVGEEGVETAIEAARLDSGAGSKDVLAKESADLLFHLMVLWAATGLTPEAVYAVLDKREGLSGLAEKAGRA